VSSPAIVAGARALGAVVEAETLAEFALGGFREGNGHVAEVRVLVMVVHTDGRTENRKEISITSSGRLYR